MSGNWRDKVEEELPYFGLGDLTGEMEIEVGFLGEGEVTETKHGEALKIKVVVISIPDDYDDLNGDEVEEDEDYYLMSSSSRFMSSLAEFADPLEGEKATISSVDSGFDRSYNVE